MRKTNFRRARTILFCIVVMTGIEAFACDPNDPLPAALPPAPNGGMIFHAEPPMDGAESPGENEGEFETVYFEGVYDRNANIISLYLLKIVPPKTAVFAPLSPKVEFDNIFIKVERPREGRFDEPDFEVTDHAIHINYDSEGVNRFIVHISGNRAGRKLVAQVQIEEE